MCACQPILGEQREPSFVSPDGVTLSKRTRINSYKFNLRINWSCADHREIPAPDLLPKLRQRHRTELCAVNKTVECRALTIILLNGTKLTLRLTIVMYPKNIVTIRASDGRLSFLPGAWRRWCPGRLSALLPVPFREQFPLLAQDVCPWLPADVSERKKVSCESV